MSKVNMRKLVQRIRFGEFAEQEPNAWENATDDEESEGDSEDEENPDDGPGCVVS